MITAGWPLRGGRGTKNYKNTKKIIRKKKFVVFILVFEFFVWSSILSIIYEYRYFICWRRKTRECRRREILIAKIYHLYLQLLSQPFSIFKGTLFLITIFGPLIYTAPYVGNVFDAGKSITRAIGREFSCSPSLFWALKFGPKQARAAAEAPSNGPRNGFARIKINSTPFQWPKYWICQHQNH